MWQNSVLNKYRLLFRDSGVNRTYLARQCREANQYSAAPCSLVIVSTGSSLVTVSMKRAQPTAALSGPVVGLIYWHKAGTTESECQNLDTANHIILAYIFDFIIISILAVGNIFILLQQWGSWMTEKLTAELKVTHVAHGEPGFKPRWTSCRVHLSTQMDSHWRTRTEHCLTKGATWSLDSERWPGCLHVLCRPWARAWDEAAWASVCCTQEGVSAQTGWLISLTLTNIQSVSGLPKRSR